MSLDELAAEIKRRARAKQDLVVPAEKLEAIVLEAGGEPELRLAVANGKRKTFRISAHVHTQLGEYTGLPPREYWGMHAEAPELLARKVNRFLESKARDSWTFRTQDGAVRAFLSESYLENEDLVEAVLPVLKERDLIVMSCAITTTWLHIKAVDRSIERDVPTGRKLGDGTHMVFDTISPGVVISNSEVAESSFSIETSIWTRACTNLAIMGEEPLQRYHLDALFSDDARKLTATAIRSRIRDLVSSSLKEANLEAEARRLTVAAKDPMEFSEAVEVVRRADERITLDSREMRAVLQHLVESHDLTRYGLHAAITRASTDVEDYDRATELERLGGRVIALRPSEWTAVLEGLPEAPRATRRAAS